MRREVHGKPYPDQNLHVYLMGIPDEPAVAMFVAVDQTHDWAAYVGGVPWPESRTPDLFEDRAAQIARDGEKLPPEAAFALFPMLDKEKHRA